MNRKILTSLLCLLCVLMPLYAMAATVDSGSCGDNVQWTLSSDGVLTISGSGAMDNYVAPYEEYADDILKVKITSGVTSIGSDAFEDLYNLASVEIASTVSSIGPGAFKGCESLLSIVIPARVTHLWDSTFYDCTALSSVSLPTGLKRIGNYVFSFCKSLTSITIPNQVTEIGDSAFCWTGLVSVVVPDSVKTMGPSVFEDCYYLESVVLPSGLETISSSMFWYCESLTTVTMPKNLRVIESGAFEDCEKLSSISLGNVLTEIGSDAFADTKLNSVEFPKTLTKIGEQAFSSCYYLASVKFNGPAPTVIGENAFAEVEAIVRYPDNLSSWTTAVRGDYGGKLKWRSLTDNTAEPIVISGSCGDDLQWTLTGDGVLTISGSGPMYDYYVWDDKEYTSRYTAPWKEQTVCRVRKLIVNKGVTSIGSGAFGYLEYLVSADIASTVSSIGENAFIWCSCLKSIAIPIRVSEIPEDAFGFCNDLKSVSFENTLRKIGNYAFEYCESLASITIPKYVTEIGVGAFDHTGLTSVVVPDSVKELGSAFRDCEKLQKVVLPDGLAAIRYSTFSNCTSLTTITMPVNLRLIEMEAFQGCSALKAISLGDVLVAIENYAFEGTALTSIEFPESLGWVGMYAFSGCEDLTSIKFNGPAPMEIGYEAFGQVTATVKYPGTSASWTSAVRENYGGALTWQSFAGTTQNKAIPQGVCGEGLTWSLQDGVLRISGVGFMEDYVDAREARYNCASWGTYAEEIRSVVIDHGVLSIGDYAFQNCVNLTNISQPTSMASYGEGCFDRCTSLTSFEMPNGVRSLPRIMFADCTALTTVILPETLEAIGESAFWRCSSLASITLPDRLKTIGRLAFYESGLKAIDIPDSVTTLDESAFADCYSLTSVKLGKGIQAIAVGCFNDTTSLSSITIPGTIREIQSNAFGLSTISVNHMNPCAKTITFEGSMPVIAEDALLRSKVTIRYPSSDTEWKAAAAAGKSYGGTVTWESYYQKKEYAIADCIIKMDYTPEFYTGKAILPKKVTVTNTGNVLKEGQHYRLEYANNIDAGTATVSIVGVGDFTGTVTRTYNILKRPAQVAFSSSSVNVKSDAAAFTHPLTAETDGKITFSSVDEAVATVNSTTGKITIKGAGSTYIYANAAEGKNYQAATARFYLTVEKAVVANPLTRDELAFKFVNARDEFDYAQGYRIPLSRYKNLFAEVEAKRRYENAGKWQGNCYGMSAAAGLFNVPDSGLSLSAFGASKTYTLTPTTYSSSLKMSLLDVIELMQVSWYHRSTIAGYQNTRNDIAGLIAEIDRSRYTRKPVVVNVRSATVGHALVAYDYEKLSSTVTQIHVYDVNFSRKARFIRVTTDAQGNYLKWFYSINNKYNSGTDYADEGSYFTYIPYSAYAGAWNARLTRNAIVNENSLYIDRDNFEIRNGDGALVAFMKDGVFTSYVNEIFQFVSPDPSYYSQTHLIYLPTAAYRVVNLEDRAMTVTMVNRHQSAVVTTTAKEVTLDVSDFRKTNMVYIDGKAGDSYSVSLESSLDCAAKLKLLEFRGTITQDARVELGTINGELYLANCDEIAIWNDGAEMGSEVTDRQQSIENFDVTLDYTQCIYTGEKRQPAVYIRNGSYELQEHRDFFVIYANDINVGTATAAIFGIGSYGGRVYRDYEILPLTASSCLNGHAWNQGTMIPSVDQTTESYWYQTCMVCGQTRQQLIPGYDFRLVKATASEVVVTLTNTMEQFIKGTFCVMVYDAKNQQIASGAQVVNLGNGRTAELKLSLTASTAPAFVCCSVVDTRSLAPMCTSILTCLTAESKELQKYVVLVEASAGGMVAQDVGMHYAGTKLTLNAIPDAGYAFDHWEATAGTITDPLQMDTTYIVTDQHATVTAVFTPQPGLEIPETGDSSHPLFDICALITSGALLLWGARKKRYS